MWHFQPYCKNIWKYRLFVHLFEAVKKDKYKQDLFCRDAFDKQADFHCQAAFFDPLCILESLSEASAVTTLITPMQYGVHGWLKAYK